jgi:hypothetical protein
MDRPVVILLPLTRLTFTNLNFLPGKAIFSLTLQTLTFSV